MNKLFKRVYVETSVVSGMFDNNEHPEWTQPFWNAVMQTLDLSQIKPIPGFDSLKWKAKIQAEILAETKGMTPREIVAYFRKGSEEFQAEIKQRRKELAEQQ